MEFPNPFCTTPYLGNVERHTLYSSSISYPITKYQHNILPHMLHQSISTGPISAPVMSGLAIGHSMYQPAPIYTAKTNDEAQQQHVQNVAHQEEYSNISGALSAVKWDSALPNQITMIDAWSYNNSNVTFNYPAIFGATNNNPSVINHNVQPIFNVDRRPNTHTMDAPCVATIADLSNNCVVAEHASQSSQYYINNNKNSNNISINDAHSPIDYQDIKLPDTFYNSLPDVVNIEGLFTIYLNNTRRQDFIKLEEHLHSYLNFLKMHYGEIYKSEPPEPNIVKITTLPDDLIPESLRNVVIIWNPVRAYLITQHLLKIDVNLVGHIRQIILPNILKLAEPIIEHIFDLMHNTNNIPKFIQGTKYVKLWTNEHNNETPAAQNQTYIAPSAIKTPALSPPPTLPSSSTGPLEELKPDGYKSEPINNNPSDVSTNQFPQVINGAVVMVPPINKGVYNISDVNMSPQPLTDENNDEDDSILMQNGCVQYHK